MFFHASDMDFDGIDLIFMQLAESRSFRALYYAIKKWVLMILVIKQTRDI